MNWYQFDDLVGTKKAILAYLRARCTTTVYTTPGEAYDVYNAYGQPKDKDLLYWMDLCENKTDPYVFISCYKYFKSMLEQWSKLPEGYSAESYMGPANKPIFVIEIPQRVINPFLRRPKY